MSFLSSLFGRRTDEDVEDTEQQEEAGSEQEPAHGRRVSDFPELHPGMSLSVTIHKGEPLLAGRLTEHNDKEISIERKPGQLSFATCALGTEACVRGISNASMPFDLKGVVVESTRVKCRIKDLEVIPYNENRVNFRLTLHTPISLYDQNDALLESPEEAELVDISVTGACFQSEYIHGEGEVLKMKVQIEDYVPRTLLGQIIRVEEAEDNKFRYGFLFAQLNDAETSALTKELFNVQVGYKREHRRDGPGHW